ncbi:MAG: D-alanyl-D-alanine carboxypeptidase family protein [Actinomycetota bacterium]|jgi:LAS superfamily LD-carboxypeptidase LdcB|nr:D-alanyl-D-alanine carboxypeptidase family protein [Actinomycetota bacterium]|tara:strand:+ start:33963 stop:35240 length:1278 start_codon:yes stop_codon:yes gene_type:complete
MGTVLAVPNASGAGKSSAQLRKEKAALEEQVRQLRKERDVFQKEILSQAQVVDTATAEVSEVEQALADLELLVAEQRDDVTRADRALEGAVLAVTAAERKSAELADQQTTLQAQVNDLALQTYIGRDSTIEGSFGLARTGDIYKAARVQTLIGAAFGDINNTSDRLRALQVDTQVATKALNEAAVRRELLQSDAAVQLEQLLEAVGLQARVVLDAEDRLEVRLFESAALAELDAEMAKEIATENDNLSRVIRAEKAKRKEEERLRLEAERKRREAEEARRRRLLGIAGAPTSIDFDRSELSTVWGIRVHESIADKLLALLKAASRDGIRLGGGGYRSSTSQIALRRAHCGTSNWAVYHKPSYQCRPPTARPGASMHERGLAVDFTQNGRALWSNTSGFRWLKRNASKYGFRNLPSEPWHWSVNGR